MEYSYCVARLSDIESELSTGGKFRFELEKYRPLSLEDFSDLRELMTKAGINTGLDIWQEFRAFYSVLNGFLLQWRYNGEEEVGPKVGSAEINMIQEIYLPEDLDGERDFSVLGMRHLFDRISPSSQVTVRFDSESSDPVLEYVPANSDESYILDLDVPQYLETLLEARALYGWQRFFVADRSFPLTPADAKAFRHALTTMFPNANASRFKSHSELG